MNLVSLQDSRFVRDGAIVGHMRLLLHDIGHVLHFLNQILFFSIWSDYLSISSAKVQRLSKL